MILLFLYLCCVFDELILIKNRYNNIFKECNEFLVIIKFIKIVGMNLEKG